MFLAGIGGKSVWRRYVPRRFAWFAASIGILGSAFAARSCLCGHQDHGLAMKHERVINNGGVNVRGCAIMCERSATQGGR